MIGGPRQVGKTTLAREFISAENQYFTWDDLEDRDVLKRHVIDTNLRTVVFDEIHKYARWRTLLKGLYDKYHARLKILVTGSAKLDHFRKGGDSLFGRYFYFRLHPLSYAETQAQYKDRTIDRLLTYGGFPEPLIAGDLTFHRRWQRERRNRVVYQDLNDLSLLRDISRIELLADLLPSKVGSGLSIKSIQEDLEASPHTVSHWIELLEKVYYCYRIAPYGSPKVRAVKKTQKLYLWDWSEIDDEGAKHENFVASQLLKYCHFLEDTQGHRMELRYLKDTEDREVDFVVMKNKKPLFAVEVKTGEKTVSPHLRYFRDRTPIPHFYQVHFGKKRFSEKKIDVLPFEDLCRELALP